MLILKQMNISRKRFFLLIALLTITLGISAQQVGSNSPYGRYGYGLLSNPTFGASEGMGGISYGLRRSQQVNPFNPASYSELDSLTFIFDMGVSGHMARMKDDFNKRDFYNGNLDYAAMQFPLFRNMGGSIGLLPYSKVGYNFGTPRSLSNIQYLETYRGTGGLSQIYGGIAWVPVRNFSVGANVSYLFGNFTHSSLITPVTSGAEIGETKHMFSIRDFKYDFGTQFTFPMATRNALTVGAVYSPKLTAKADVRPSKMMYSADPYQNPYTRPTQILPSDTLLAQNFQLPHTFGLGFTYTRNNLLFGLDGTYQLWDGLDYPDALDGMTKDTRFNNAYRLNAGLEYVVNPVSQNFFERIRFRGGLSFANSYTQINVYNPETSQQAGIGGYKEYGVNIGLGLPFHDYLTGHVSMLNIAFGYTRQQPDMNFMIKQDMFKISINMNINEFWFFKRQFD